MRILTEIIKFVSMMAAILLSTVSFRAHAQEVSGWDYRQWPWLNGVVREFPMTTSEGLQYYKVLKEFVLDEKSFRAAIKDGYDSVPWARSAPCATTTSAVLEHSLRIAQDRFGGRFEWYADMFGQHDQFGPTHNVEIALYKSGWTYWSLKKFNVQVGIGLLGGRYLWNGVPKHSGHIYTTFGLSQGGEVLIGDNGGYNHPYRGKGWEVGTEGIWLPPGIEATPKTAIDAEPDESETPFVEMKENTLVDE